MVGSPDSEGLSRLLSTLKNDSKASTACTKCLGLYTVKWGPNTPNYRESELKWKHPILCQTDLGSGPKSDTSFSHRTEPGARAVALGSHRQSSWGLSRLALPGLPSLKAEASKYVLQTSCFPRLGRRHLTRR